MSRHEWAPDQSRQESWHDWRVIASFSVVEETLNLTINKRETPPSSVLNIKQEQMLLLFVFTFCDVNHQQRESLKLGNVPIGHPSQELGAVCSCRVVTKSHRLLPLTPVQGRGRAKGRNVLGSSARSRLTLLAVSNSNPCGYPEHLMRRECFNPPTFPPF